MKLIGTNAGETPDQTIIRCANNLVKAVIAARGMEALHRAQKRRGDRYIADTVIYLIKEGLKVEGDAK